MYLIRACGLNAPSSPIPGVGLGGLVPRTESVVMGGLPFTSGDYCDFRTYGSHMRIDDLSAPSGRFVARVSASVATVDRCPGRGRVLPAADNDFSSVFAVPTEVGTGSSEAPAAATAVAQMCLYQTPGRRPPPITGRFVNTGGSEPLTGAPRSDFMAQSLDLSIDVCSGLGTSPLRTNIWLSFSQADLGPRSAQELFFSGFLKSLKLFFRKFALIASGTEIVWRVSLKF